MLLLLSSCFFFNDPATTEIYTLSLHDALPIWVNRAAGMSLAGWLDEIWLKIMERIDPKKKAAWITDIERAPKGWEGEVDLDRKSTRLNSSHGYISYAVFCLKKKKKTNKKLISI